MGIFTVSEEFFKKKVVLCLVWLTTQNLITLYVHECGYGWINIQDISHLSSVYPNLLSELGDDSGFCNAIVSSTFPHRMILICQLLGSL